jgi:hypothetical protein
MYRVEHTFLVGHVHVTTRTRLAWLRRAQDDRVISMSLDMFLQILRTLEGFATEFTFVRFQGNVDSNVRGDMVAFDGCGTAATPLTRQVEVIGTLAADVSFTDMFLLYQSVGGASRLGAMAGEEVCSTHVERFS